MARQKLRILSLVMLLLFAFTVLTGCIFLPRRSDDSDPTTRVHEDSDEEEETGLESELESDTESEDATDVPHIGIAMPTSQSYRWLRDGSNIESQLEDAGYDVTLVYAEKDLDTQIEQIDEMVDDGCGILIVAPVIGYGLEGALDRAKEKDVTIIAFDRLPLETESVDYYITYDNFAVGQQQGEYIIEALDLANTDGPYNIELFAGSYDDWNADVYYEGALDVLEPYMDSGKLVVVSGETKFRTVAIDLWDTVNARERMELLLSEYYADGRHLDAVLGPNDSVALGIVDALIAAEVADGADWPIITGQDCMPENVINIIEGKQSMSVFKDTDTLVAELVIMVDKVVSGELEEEYFEGFFDNEAKDVPTKFCPAFVVDATNYKERLIDTGYYTAADLIAD